MSSPSPAAAALALGSARAAGPVPAAPERPAPRALPRGRLCFVRGTVPAADAAAGLRELRRTLEHGGAEMVWASETELVFGLSAAGVSRFPARDEFGPEPTWRSFVRVDGPALRYELSVADAHDLAAARVLFVAPLLVIAPIAAVGSGSPLPWLGVALALAGAAASWAAFRRDRARIDAAFRELLATVVGHEPPRPAA